jgi:hypothetical protein
MSGGQNQEGSIMVVRLGLLPPAVALALALCSATAAAQDAQPARLVGEISSVEANNLVVKTSDGKEARLELGQDTKVFALSPAKAEVVAAEAMIGASGPQQQKERIRADIVVVYPPASAGASEDYLTWDTSPETAMRSGVVRSVENGPDGRIVSISYPQGGATVVIAPEAKVMALEPADRSLLKKGAHIYVPSAKKRPDGSMAAAAVVVGKDGFKPPL